VTQLELPIAGAQEDLAPVIPLNRNLHETLVALMTTAIIAAYLQPKPGEMKDEQSPTSYEDH
jgi:hypothetical protein